MAYNRQNNILHRVTPNHRLYDMAVDEYKTWLKSPEGMNSTDEQKRLKRRSLFMPANRVVDPQQDTARRRVNFLQTQEADNFRRAYEAQRLERPNLRPNSAYNVMIRNNPNLLRGMTPQQHAELYNRYVAQDSRVRGDAPGISNSNYDIVLFDKNRSTFNKALNTGAANFVTNFANPVMQGAAFPVTFYSDLASKAILAGVHGYNKLTGDMVSPDNWVVRAGAGLERISNSTGDLINRIAPTKTQYADSDLGETTLDKVNQVTNFTSHLGGMGLGFGGLSASAKVASPLPSVRALRTLSPTAKTVARVKNPLNTFKAVSRLKHPLRYTAGAVPRLLGSTWRGANTMAGATMSSLYTLGNVGRLLVPNTSEYYDDRVKEDGLYGPARALVKDNKGNTVEQLLQQAPEGFEQPMGEDQTRYVYSNLRPNNYSLNRAIKQIKDPQYARAVRAAYLKRQGEAIKDQESGVSTLYKPTGAEFIPAGPNDLKYKLRAKDTYK